MSETAWRQTQRVLPPLAACAIPGCVHDGELGVRFESDSYRLCRSHYQKWRYHMKTTGYQGTRQQWNNWFAAVSNGPSVTPIDRRGQVSFAKLSVGLQREIRYAIHRHANTPRRTQWRPVELQKVVNLLAERGVRSLTDQLVADLASNYPTGSMERRVLVDLPVAARSLVVSAEMAKAAGWFDSIIVGGAPFQGADVSIRSKPWDLTGVSQRWLRDLLWDYLRDEALKPKGKRPVKGTVSRRITAVVLLSYALRQVRDDQGNDPLAVSSRDAGALKEIWDLWFREQIPLPNVADRPNREPGVFNERARHSYMASSRIILRHSREQGRTPANMDLFIFNLPEYPRPPRSPRPRPLTYGDFKLLVSSDNINFLENADRDDVGLADIWLTQPFQGGRINETIRLRLGASASSAMRSPTSGATSARSMSSTTACRVTCRSMSDCFAVRTRRARDSAAATPPSSHTLMIVDEQRWRLGGIVICRCSPAQCATLTSCSKFHNADSATLGQRGSKALA